MRLRIVSGCLVAVALIVTACGHQASWHLSLPTDSPPSARSILAGEWEYEDGGAVALRLDEQGNGTYAFKDGRFETVQFDGRRWVGKWYQKENDREGGFLVNLSADYADGEGTWWYDRIGTNTSPAEKGGTFHLSRKTSVTSLGATPPAP